MPIIIVFIFLKMGYNGIIGCEAMDLKEGKILEKISDVYLFIMILLFPLIVDNTGYYHILECKWNAFLIITGSYIILNLLVIIYFLIIKKVNYFKGKKLNLVQKLALVFFSMNFISCFLSPFFNDYDLFVGSARREGLITMSFYILSFLNLTMFAKFKRRHVLYLITASLLISIIAVFQYVGFNPFHLFKDSYGIHNAAFMTTIGNKDFISAIYCLLLPISFSLYIFKDDLKIYEKALCLLSIVLGSLIFGVIDVSSGKVAFFLSLVILFPFIIVDNKRISKFLEMYASILGGYLINAIVNPEYHYDIKKLGLYFQFNYITLLYIVVIVLLIFLAQRLRHYEFKKNVTKRYLKKYVLFLIVCVLIGLISIYFVNFKSGILYELHELLHGNFDDNFGSYRIFLWKRTMNMLDYHPIFGTGPDTFFIRFMARYTPDIIKIGPLTINDTAANVYLTMLINVGFVGLVSYLVFIASQIKKIFNNVNIYSLVLFSSFICYLIQDIFNLWIVIVTPIFWISMTLYNLSFKGVEKCNTV